MQLDCFDGLSFLQLGDLGVSKMDGYSAFPFGAEGHGGAELSDEVVQHHVVIHDDPDVAVHRGPDRHQDGIANLELVVEDRFEAMLLVSLVEIQVRVLPEPSGASVIRKSDGPRLLVIVPGQLVAVLPALRIRPAGQFTVVEHERTPEG